MSLCDFEQLTPDEWRATCKSWHASREEESRERWEQVRWLGTVSVQPHVRKRLSPRDLLHFPWDDKTRESAPVMSREEHMKRMEAAIQRMGRYLDKDGRNGDAAKETGGGGVETGGETAGNGGGAAGNGGGAAGNGGEGCGGTGRNGGDKKGVNDGR